MYVVDTHALIWYFEDDVRLGKAAFHAMDDNEATIVVPTIVLAEVHYLYLKKRVDISLNVIEEKLTEADNVLIIPLDVDCQRVHPHKRYGNIRRGTSSTVRKGLGLRPTHPVVRRYRNIHSACIMERRIAHDLVI